LSASGAFDSFASPKRPAKFVELDPSRNAAFD